jgi:hypothetical protein
MTHDKPMNDSKNNRSSASTSMDVEWLAFQYLTGELPEASVVYFEECLENDQLAREALARTVELTQAMAMVESTTGDVPSNDTPCVRSPIVATQFFPHDQAGKAWMARVAWSAVAALAGLAALLFWNPRTSPPSLDPGGQPVAATDVSVFDSGELASLWVETGELLVTTTLVSDGESIDGLLDDEPLASHSEPTVRAEVNDDRLQAPSWMMAALAGFTDAEKQE